ncbi:RNA-binding protein 48 [Corythoichthys intestinalis]|uniref:RNA-binding protein 48 n=1 Tax=Corythoichthys intestinalis TaxID=161448 RepID=UPI0025A5C30A|nr:RNA-binding protein 48 [Corythoichthys intestinalis]XP_061788881.1 RNA-binding protein 48-like [Nerophis lumbriciformis]
MAAASSSCWKAPGVYKHHEQRKVCISRPKYREGRKARAVKVYTINLESCYVMVQGVPAIGVMAELIQLCALYGVVQEYRPLDEYPAEEFTEVYLIKFQKLTSARAAKRHMDEKSFYGGVLHVCYVPEYETVEDTRIKLQDQKRYVMRMAQNRVREREQEGAVNEEITSADSTLVEPTPTIIPTQCEMSDHNNEAECWNVDYHASFPLLPLPPQEHHYSAHKSHMGTLPTEDKMGTLHNAIVHAEETSASNSSHWQKHSHKSRGAQVTLTSNQPSAGTFAPRTTQLESRKRKMEELVSNCPAEVIGKSEPLIGPKLEDAPKVDMEDDSLNTTVNIIRNTMKKVESVPDFKPVGKKMKPRRRI